MKTPSWGVWKKTFERLVLIGVLGELLADGGIFLFSSHLQTISDAEVAHLNVEAAHLNVEAETAHKQTETLRKETESLRLDVSTAKARGAEAIEKAEREHLARVKIEKRLAARRVNKEQMRQVATALKPFRGRTVHMGVVNGTQEAEQFWTDLVLTFRESVITVESMGTSIHLGPAFPPFTITSGGASMPFAQAILSAFKAAKIIDPSEDISVGNQGPGIDEVNIRISRKSYP